VSQVFHFLVSKGKFVLFDKQFVFLQQVKDFVHMKKVAIPSATVNENVVKENQEKISKVRFQSFIHESLEGGWGITRPKVMTKNS
jgi:hypothetical protein